MGYIRRETVAVTTDGSGNATAYTSALNGQVMAIVYSKDASTPFSNGVTFLLTAELSGATLWSQAAVNASATVAPRQATHGTDGSASLYAAGGSPVQAPVCVGDERLKIVVSAGGASKVGSFTFLVQG